MTFEVLKAFLLAKESSPLPNLGIFAEIVENGSKWLELSELNRFRHAQIDSETLRKI